VVNSIFLPCAISAIIPLKLFLLIILVLSGYVRGFVVLFLFSEMKPLFVFSFYLHVQIYRFQAN
jgi:hypothetical protein